ncbi:MAG: hypothetical protein EOO81_02175 [Oxalobacteraceae bacterium]|nr:MAG: hypothetical protein EOO81_02175 [Oxalobacteraceae bacterium]
MRNLIALALLAVSATVFADEPTEQEVHDGIRKGVVFGILPAADGKLERCQFSMTQDGPTNKPDPDFKPSEKFVSEACRKLAKGKWMVSRDRKGEIKEVFDYCMWSEVIPDSPICRAELGE